VVEELKKIIKEVNVNFYEVFASVFHFLKKFYILNFSSFIYITKDKHRFLKYKPALQEDRLKYKEGRMAIQGYKDLDI